MTQVAERTAQIANIDALSARIAIASIAKQAYTHLTVYPINKCVLKQKKPRDIVPLSAKYINRSTDIDELSTRFWRVRTVYCEFKCL